WKGPIYIRLAKGFDPIVSKPENGFTIGKAIVLRRAKSRGGVLMVATGVMTTRALQAAESLADQGIETTLLHMHTVKPLDEEAIRHHAQDAKLILTLEEHTTIGGLGSAVTDALVN